MSIVVPAPAAFELPLHGASTSAQIAEPPDWRRAFDEASSPVCAHRSRRIEALEAAAARRYRVRTIQGKPHGWCSLVATYVTQQSSRSLCANFTGQACPPPIVLEPSLLLTPAPPIGMCVCVRCTLLRSKSSRSVHVEFPHNVVVEHAGGWYHYCCEILHAPWELVCLIALRSTPRIHLCLAAPALTSRGSSHFACIQWSSQTI